MNDLFILWFKFLAFILRRKAVILTDWNGEESLRLAYKRKRRWYAHRFRFGIHTVRLYTDGTCKRVVKRKYSGNENYENGYCKTWVLA